MMEMNYKIRIFYSNKLIEGSTRVHVTVSTLSQMIYCVSMCAITLTTRIVELTESIDRS
jgi:hypothetical protein